jgi:hypothetical protein
VITVLVATLSQLETQTGNFARTLKVDRSSEVFTSFKDLRNICMKIYKVSATAVGISQIRCAGYTNRPKDFDLPHLAEVGWGGRRI